MNVIYSIALIACFILIGLCAGCSVTGDEIARADAYCEKHGEVETINSLHKVAVCKSGHATSITPYND